MATFDAQPLSLYLDGPNAAPWIVACLKETHGKVNTLTSHPIEKGSPITDHSRPEPLQVQFECVASKTLPAEGYAEAEALWDRLQQLHDSPILIDAVSIGGVYTDMGIETVARTVDAKTANAVFFTISLKHVKVVSNKFTQVKVTRETKGQRKKKQGAIATDEVEPTPSWATSALSTFGGG